MSYNIRIVGTCSLCGGPVGVPQVWCGTIPPMPTCQNCYATAAEGYGPVVQMKPAPQIAAPAVWRTRVNGKTPADWRATPGDTGLANVRDEDGGVPAVSGATIEDMDDYYAEARPSQRKRNNP